MKPTSAGSKSEMRSASLAGRSETQENCALTVFFSGSIFPVLMLVLQLGHVLLVNDGAALRCADE